MKVKGTMMIEKRMGEEIPVKAAIAAGKNHKILLMMMMTATAAATTASAAATTSVLGRKLMKGLQIKTRLPPQKIPQSSSGWFDDEGFLAGFGRKLIKRKNGHLTPKN